MAQLGLGPMGAAAAGAAALRALGHVHDGAGNATCDPQAGTISRGRLQLLRQLDAERLARSQLEAQLRAQSQLVYTQAQQLKQLHSYHHQLTERRLVLPPLLSVGWAAPALVLAGAALLPAGVPAEAGERGQRVRARAERRCVWRECVRAACVRRRGRVVRAR